MSFDVERALLGIQRERVGERLPMESILNAIRESEYGDHLFMRDHGPVDDTPQALIDRFMATHRTGWR